MLVLIDRSSTSGVIGGASDLAAGTASVDETVVAETAGLAAATPLATASAVSETANGNRNERFFISDWKSESCGSRANHESHVSHASGAGPSSRRLSHLHALVRGVSQAQWEQQLQSEETPWSSPASR